MQVLIKTIYFKNILIYSIYFIKFAAVIFHLLYSKRESKENEWICSFSEQHVKQAQTGS